MNFSIKFRLAALGVAIALSGAIIALLTFNAQHQVASLRDRLNAVDSESYRIADHFKDSLREVNNTLLRFGMDRDPAVWQQFLNASHVLDLWMDQQSAKLTTAPEKDALDQMNTAYDNYQSVASQLHSKLLPGRPDGASLAEFTEIRAVNQRLFDLGQGLAKAHLDSRNLLLSEANETLIQLRRSVLVSLGLLFICGVALALGVYRHMIAPLRMRLVESQTLAERQEKLASLGMLAAGVAHEIRNPLTAVKAALFIQQKRFAAGSPERADAQVVEREILRLERIVNDFLQFARPTDPQLAAIAADGPLQEVQSFFAPQLARQNIELVVEESPPIQINVDRGQIRQALINLVQNAADSVGRHGTITLRARKDRKKLGDGETDVAILEVADTGKGIPPEVERRLFDPFFTTKASGTGLGLSIAARIIQKHGGLLQYQTQVNRGTTFGIVLPRAAS